MTYVREHRVHCGILECINGIHCRHFNVCVSVNQVSLINRWLSRVCASYVVTIEICEMIKKCAAFIVNGIFPVLFRFAEIKRLPPLPPQKKGENQRKTNQRNSGEIDRVLWRSVAVQTERVPQQ